jgi:CRISPR-associated protein Cas2
MMVVVSYDVSTTTKSGKKRLNKVAKTCLDFGIRAQNSVFECIVDPAQWEILKNRLLDIYKAEEDNLRFYYLGSNYKRRIESYGKSKSLNIDETLIL